MSEPKISLNLNCYLLGDDPSRIFPVEVEQHKNVGDLKKKIKEDRAHALADVDASDLDVFQVRRLYG
jgi:hypothetical protein